MTRRILALFVLVNVNIIYNGVGLLSSGSIGTLTGLILCVTAPYIVVGSYMQRFSMSLLGNFKLITLITALGRLILVLITQLIFHSDSSNHHQILQFTAIFTGTNCVTLPLRRTLLKRMNIFCNTTCVVMFGIVL